MPDLNTKQNLNGPETVVAGPFFNLASSNLEPLKRIFNGPALIAGCSPQIFDFAATLKPRTIPLYIPLGPNLTNPAEISYAQAVAEHLSGKIGRAVEVSELKGLFLYLWSEDDPDGRALDDYLGDSSRPLQAFLLEARILVESNAESLVSAELLALVGQRFEILPRR